ncbi:zona pellucida sperm-binding protein 3 [Fundulus heteroclitus]|uniref:zona pellucida sperm-binding protein 3 n=1 Tax=Fundulus heteroclitus TaxID=8078 RepID=UPI00165A7CE0|nr:zona pellucida sperm-binding protein 3 [Fundulus heteroclitus]
MESRQLLVFSFLLACGSLGDALLRGMKPPGYWGAVIQTAEAAQAKSPLVPVKEPFSLFAEKANGFHSKRIQPAAEQPRWKFPEGPVDPERPVAPVNKPPAQVTAKPPTLSSSRVAVRCGESKVHVEVKQDLLGIGKLIHPDEITLGGCPPAGMDPSSRVLIFESELHGCGSTLEVSQDGLLYAFKLIYNPKMSVMSPIVRSQRTVVDVECLYTN